VDRARRARPEPEKESTAAGRTRRRSARFDAPAETLSRVVFAEGRRLPVPGDAAPTRRWASRRRRLLEVVAATPLRAARGYAFNVKVPGRAVSRRLLS
jgi:hypothetical protein